MSQSRRPANGGPTASALGRAKDARPGRLASRTDGRGWPRARRSGRPWRSSAASTRSGSVAFESKRRSTRARSARRHLRSCRGTVPGDGADTAARSWARSRGASRPGTRARLLHDRCASGRQRLGGGDCAQSCGFGSADLSRGVAAVRCDDAFKPRSNSIGAGSGRREADDRRAASCAALARRAANVATPARLAP
jgi:hypothetical protein